MHNPKGVEIATVCSGTKYRDRDDVLVIRFAKDTTLAAIFTTNSMPAAPVIYSRNIAQTGLARALVVNAGNANAFTGDEGLANTKAICDETASSLGVDMQTIMAASTGVIGKQLDVKAIKGAARKAAGLVGSANWQDAAEAIRTTDTFAKVVSRSVKIGDCSVNITAICKGSGMIEPNMATMLAFVVTDASISSAVLDTLLRRANARSFACVTVDSDTSTNDCCMVFATHTCTHPVVSSADDQILVDFAATMQDVMQELAIMLARDGEGATKLVAISVAGANNDEQARIIAKAVANSPLVKTAIAGEDANWGRIVMAIGKSGQPVSPDKVAIEIGGIAVAKDGGPIAGFDEAQVDAHFKQKDIAIDIAVGDGSGTALVWTCDLTHGYISINADYRS